MALRDLTGASRVKPILDFMEAAEAVGQGITALPDQSVETRFLAVLAAAVEAARPECQLISTGPLVAGRTLRAGPQAPMLAPLLVLLVQPV